MTSHNKRLFLASIVAAVGGLAMAQTAVAATASADKLPARRQFSRADRKQHGAERGAHRMAELKTELGITAEQEPAWQAYVDAMQPGKPQADAQRPDFSKLSTPERIDYMQSRQGERQQHMNQRLDAIKTFYGQLTPEQQAIYDQKKMHAWGGKSRGPRRHHGRRHG